jgi:hypothetical protein
MPEIRGDSDVGFYSHFERGGLELTANINRKLAVLLKIIAGMCARPCENDYVFDSISSKEMPELQEMRDLAGYRIGDRTELARQLDQEIAAELARRERWSGTVKQLHSLPQLFIAV